MEDDEKRRESREYAPSGNLPDPFDRLMGLYDGLIGVTRTKPSTITIPGMLGMGTETYIVQTVRQRDISPEAEAGQSRDTIFLQRILGNVATRIAIPARVADTIARQRDSLGTITRRKVGKERAAEMKAQGIKPNTSGLERWRKAGGKRRSRKQR